MAGSQKPGPQNPSSNPQNIRDGTTSLQSTPKPSTSGFWQTVESAANGVYEALSNRLSSFSNQSLSAFNLKTTLVAKYGEQAAEEAEKYFGYITDQVKNAADWDSLNKVAGPALGQESFQAGVVIGFGESLVGDVASLLGLLKMLVLAGIYERTQSPSTLIVDPMAAVMILAVRSIPSFARETKAADEQLRKMTNELFEIAKHPLDFIEAVGKNVWKGGMDDLEQLKFYAHQNTLMSQFQAGRIAGRVMYQVMMAILMVIGAAGAVAKLASKVPELLRVAGILGKGGELGDLVEITEAGGGAAEAVEKGPEFVKVDDFGKTQKVAPELEAEAPKPGQPKLTAIKGGKEPNTATWFQDEKGRTVRVEADLKQSYKGLERGPDEAKAQQAASALGQSGDQGGHIIAHRFLGDQGPKNLFPQEANFNNSAYKKMENEIAAWTEQGKEVKLNVRLEFDPPNSDRPSIVAIKYRVIDPATGEQVYSNGQDFLNQTGQVFERVPTKDMPNY